MQRQRAMKTITCFFLTLTFALFPALPGFAAELTQRDWMITLVDACGWSYGLPDEPQDPDYINILTGNRVFRFEAEDIHAQDEDNVSLMTFQNFGTFSGRGWLHGTREPTLVHLRFTLPLTGEYQLQAKLRQAGHQFAVNGVQQSADADQEFTQVNVGIFSLQAGEQEIIVTLPPNGSIDHITLRAPNLAAITPAGDWQPDEPLTWEVMETTMLQLFHLAELFPSDQTSMISEAEDLAQKEVPVVDIPHLGHPSGGKWLRTGPLPADVRFPIKLTKSGFYDLSLRAMGDPINIIIADHQGISLKAKEYLDDYQFKSLFLFAGESNITLTLPAGGGVDLLSLTGRQTDAAATETLLGLNRQGHPTVSNLDTLTALLAAFGVER